jgi:hypothetical protein
MSQLDNRPCEGAVMVQLRVNNHPVGPALPQNHAAPVQSRQQRVRARSFLLLDVSPPPTRASAEGRDGLVMHRDAVLFMVTLCVSKR